MQITLERPCAQILPFVLRDSQSNRFTMADRIQLLQWQGSHGNRVGAHIDIYALQPDDAPDAGDYAAIYRANDLWAVWGLVRKGRMITVWHGPSGADLGVFDTLADALAAITPESIHPLTPRRQ